MYCKGNILLSIRVNAVPVNRQALFICAKAVAYNVPMLGRSANGASMKKVNGAWHGVARST